jgi:hypothetical protein
MAQFHSTEDRAHGVERTGITSASENPANQIPGRRHHFYLPLANVLKKPRRSLLFWGGESSLLCCCFFKMSSVMEKDIEAGNSSLDSQHDAEVNTPEAEKNPASAMKADVEDESEYISGIRLYLIILGLCMAVLLIGLVRCCRWANLVLKLTLFRITLF